MVVRIFLGLSVLIWLPYGVYCLLAPHALAASAGLTAVSATGTTELRAMYGGLQMAIGLLAAFALFRGSLRPAALVALGFLTLGLGTGRLFGMALDGDVSQYSGFALVFEFASAAAAVWLHSREIADQPRLPGMP